MPLRASDNDNDKDIPNTFERIRTATELAFNDASGKREWANLLQEGKRVREEWVHDGLLVSSTALSAAWGCSHQGLSQAAKRGDMFAVKVGKNLYFPSVFKSLDADAVKAVCSQLKGDDSVAKFIFWNKTHGGLDGLAPADAIKARQCDKVVRLAQAWSTERGLNL